MSDLQKPVIEGTKKGLEDAGSFFLHFPERVLNAALGSPNHVEASSSSARVVRKVAKTAVEDSSPSLSDFLFKLALLGIAAYSAWYFIKKAEEERKGKERNSPAECLNFRRVLAFLIPIILIFSASAFGSPADVVAKGAADGISSVADFIGILIVVAIVGTLLTTTGGVVGCGVFVLLLLIVGIIVLLSKRLRHFSSRFGVS